MEIRDIVRISWTNITSHKLRSVLTTLGVIIGVASVIAVVTMAAGFQEAYINRFSQMFLPDAFTVQVGKVRRGFEGGIYGADFPTFTERDVEAIRSIAGVREVYPIGVLYTDPIEGVKFRGEAIGMDVRNIRVFAVPPGYLPQDRIKWGRVFKNENEAVIGYDLAKEIAEELRSADNVESALRRRIELKIVSEDGSETRRYTVVGILKDLPMLSSVILLNIDGNYDIKRQVPGRGVDMVYHVIEVRVNSVSQIGQVKDAVLEYLNDRSDAVRFLKRDAPKLEFVIISLEDLTNFVREQIDMFANFVTMIGSISLLVGSIGISNIMLVNVTERTREIGVLRALGARRSVILQLFLVESVLIGVVGALLGVAFGMILGLVFIRLGPFAALNAPFVIVLDWIPIAVGVGAAVGAVSGIYPAWRAAKTDPVHALRHE